MGGNQSRVPPPQRSRKYFYLQFGKPTIRYARDDGAGPLIFNVEYDEDEQDERDRIAPVELACGVPATQRFILQRCPHNNNNIHGGKPSSQDVRLTFRVSFSDPGLRLRVFRNAHIHYVEGLGVQLFKHPRTRAGGGDALTADHSAPDCVLDTGEDGVVLGQSYTTTVPFRLDELKPTEMSSEDGGGPSSSPPPRPRSAGEKKRPPPHAQRLVRAPLVIALTLPSVVAPEIRRQVVLYTFLDLPRHDGNGDGAHNNATTTTNNNNNNEVGLCTVAKQLLQLDAEVYELDNVFDTGAEAEGSEDGEDDLCVICLTEAVDTTLLPCRHRCLCHECCVHLKMGGNKCPICREKIEQTLTQK